MCQNVKMIRLNADLYVRSDSCGVAKETVTITGMYVRLCASHDYICTYYSRQVRIKEALGQLGLP